jgi:nitronate monooxygenase
MSADEGRLAAAAGMDALAVQSSAAGGHWGTLTLRRPPLPQARLEELVAQVGSASELPIMAAGGIADPTTVRAAIVAGAAAVAVGTVLMLSPEAGRHVRHPSGGAVYRRPADRGDEGLHRAAGQRTPQCVHRPLRRPCAVRLSGVAPFDEPNTPGRCGGRRSRLASPLGRDRLPGRDNRSRRVHHAPANGPTVTRSDRASTTE